MKVDENELREELRIVISDAENQVKQVKDKIKELAFARYGMTAGEVMNILNGKSPVELMTKEIMYKITDVLHDIYEKIESVIDVHNLEVDKYFTDKEKSEFNVKLDRSVIDEDVVIKNWLYVEKDQSTTVWAKEEILNAYNMGKIHYNFETQREATIKETKTGKVKVITFSPDAFNDICSDMISGDYISDDITFNVNPDYYEPPKVVRGNLVISKESQIDCIDGFHRLKAYLTVCMLIPDWEKNMIINIMSFDKDKANRYIIQKDKKFHLSEKQVANADSKDAANFIINDKLNTNSKSHIKNTIDKDKAFTLNKIITKLFEPKKLVGTEERQEAVALYQYIEKNINDLIEYEKMFDVEITKEMWFIYLYVLKHCYDNNADFIETMAKLPMERLLSEIKISNQPVNKHYKIMNEVFKNG